MALGAYFVLVTLLVLFERSQQNDSDLVPVEVSPFDLSSDVRMEKISKQCAELGICEKSTHYPKMVAQNLRGEITDTNVILDRDDPKNLRLFEGDVHSSSEIANNPCFFSPKTLAPQIARDVNGTWHYALNFDDEPLQQYNVQICKASSSNPSHNGRCGPLVTYYGSIARCIQKYVVRTILVIKNKVLTPVPFYIPCCCTCVSIPDN